MIELQMALMDAVPSVVAAWNVHRGKIEIASTGLCFLKNLAANPENQVAP
jgi:hypothetical protein